MAKTKSKIKTVSPDISTREEFSVLCGEIGALQTRLNARKLEQTRRIDELNKEFTDIETLTEELGALMKPALAWCVANEEKEFADSKTLEFVRASAQFRVGNPEVKFRSQWTVADVLTELRSFLVEVDDANAPGGKRLVEGKSFIRTVEELDKAQIIKDRNLISAQDWLALGIKIVQEKSLIVTPKGEKLEDKQTLKEAA